MCKLVEDLITKERKEQADQSATEIALKLLEMGAEVDYVAEATSLSQEKINSLKQCHSKTN